MGISLNEDLVEEKSDSKNHKISPKSPAGGKTKFQTKYGNRYANEAELETFIENRNNLEKCHQIVFVLKYFASKFAKRCNRKCILAKFCGICDFTGDEKNKIYEFIRELNENLVPSCDFLRDWTTDLFQSGTPGASKSYHKLHSSLHINSGKVSPTRQIVEEMNNEETKNSIFKNLKDIAKKAGSLEAEIAKILEELKKDKALNAKHEKIDDNTNNDDCNDTNYTSMSKELVKDHVNKFSKSSREFVGYCLSNRFIEAFKGKHEVNVGKKKFNEIPSKYYEKRIAEYLKEQKFEIGFYETTKENIEKRLKNICHVPHQVGNNDCMTFLEGLLENWKGYCSIDTDQLILKSVEEFIHSMDHH
uniref:Uncharacterized protein n=1 Tax=Meloidogyne javanica TaxID=6303 RepID=A0A915MEY0_MELJA